jgi:hypothetical protein
VLNALFYELPLDELQTYRERVNAVTPEDIQRVAQQYLKPDRLSVVLVGNVDAFASQLRGVGFGRYETVGIGDLDLTAADFRRAGSPSPGGGFRWSGLNGHPADKVRMEPLAMSDSGIAVASLTLPPSLAPVRQEQASSKRSAADDLIRKVIEAKGGLDKLRAVKTVVAEAKTTLTSPQGEKVEATTRTYVEYPNRFRVDATIQGTKVSQTYNAGSAWLQDPGGVRDAPEPMREEFNATVRRELITLLVSAVEGSAATRLLTDAKQADGRVLKAIELTMPGVEPVVIYVDPSTNLITRQTYATRGPAGPDRVEETFGDYRRVDGLQVAFKASVKRGGVTILEREVTDFKVNVPVEPDVFKKPQS